MTKLRLLDRDDEAIRHRRFGRCRSPWASGAMTDERMAEFFAKMVDVGVLPSPADLDYTAGLHARLRQLRCRSRSEIRARRRVMADGRTGLKRPCPRVSMRAGPERPRLFSRSTMSDKVFGASTVALPRHATRVPARRFHLASSDRRAEPGTVRPHLERSIAGPSCSRRDGRLRLGGARGPDTLGRGPYSQEPTLMPWATSGRQRLAALANQGQAPRRKSCQQSRKLLARSAPHRFRRRHPRELSAGNEDAGLHCPRTRHSPALILMDEPFAALDEITPVQAQTRSSGDAREARLTVIFVTHSVVRERLPCPTASSSWPRGRAG